MSLFIYPLLALFLLFYTHLAEAKTYGASLCHRAGYSCYLAKPGDNWQRLFPDPEERDLVMRINRMNTRLYPGMRIAVPNNLKYADPLHFSPFLRQINPPGSKVIIVSLNQLAFGAYNSQGTLLYWGPISGGKGYCPDIRRGCHTKTGLFAIYQKGGAGCKSTKYPVGRGGAPMPYCMFFSGGFALHGSPEVPGYHASHGCVRLYTQDAQWLSQEFTAGERSVSVIVKK